MGWLDNSTNNIILDAVLTDYGRQQLAAASNSFNVTHYSLADDEVDYRMIKRYGRAVGKEKIEKNTPIFEALTNPSIAMKYKLVGRENDGSTVSIVYMPYLQTSSTNLAFTQTTVKQTAKVDLYYNKSTAVPPNLLQTSYTIKVPDRFLYLSNPGGGGTLTSAAVARNSIDAGDPNRIAYYTYIAAPGQTSISFDVLVRGIDNTALTVYGKRTGNGNDRVLTTYITVVGNNHGPSIDVPVTYSAATTS